MKQKMEGLIKLATIAVFTGMSWVSVSLTHQNIRNADVSVFSQQIDENKNLTAESFKYHINLLSSDDFWPTCRTDQLAPQLNLRMNELDFFFGHEEVAITRLRLSNSYAFIMHLLKCTPTDGNALALGALIANAIRHDDEKLARMLTLSQQYAPVRLQIVMLRVKLVLSAPHRTDRALAMLLDKDLKVVDLYFKPTVIHPANKGLQK